MDNDIGNHVPRKKTMPLALNKPLRYIIDEKYLKACHMNFQAYPCNYVQELGNFGEKKILKSWVQMNLLAIWS